MSKYPDNPPPYGFNPPQNPQQMPVTVPAVVVLNANAVGSSSQTMTCPSCHHQISTRVDPETATKTHIMALLLCLFGCWPCAPLPYCMDSCKNVNHYCPKCGAFIGTYQS